MGALSAEVGASDDGDIDDDESGLGNEDDERKDDDDHQPRLKKNDAGGLIIHSGARFIFGFHVSIIRTRPGIQKSTTCPSKSTSPKAGIQGPSTGFRSGFGCTVVTSAFSVFYVRKKLGLRLNLRKCTFIYVNCI